MWRSNIWLFLFQERGLLYAFDIEVTLAHTPCKGGELVRERKYVGYIVLPRYAFAVRYEIYQTNIC
jgi:hypothetical protein